MSNKTTLLKSITTQTQRVPLVQVHIRTESIDEMVLCGLVSEFPSGIDFLIGNDIWLKAHCLPDRVTEQAVTTCSTANKTRNTSNKTTQCTSHLITAMNAKTSTTSVTNYSKNVKKLCADNLTISDSHQSKKLSLGHSTTISVKPSKRRIQRTYHRSQKCANTVPTVEISNTDSHDTCIQRFTDVKYENLSAQQSAQQHNVVTYCSKHFTDDPGKTVRDHEIRLKPGSRHSKPSPYRVNTKKSSLAAPPSATVLLYHIIVCLLHILADLLKEIDRLEQQIPINKRRF